MSTNQNTNSNVRKNILTGAAFILIGAYLFTAQFVQAKWMGLVFLPGLGFIFLSWGIITKNFGLLIPGGILAGLGTGAFMIEGPFSAIDEINKGGIVMLSFAAGWLLITLLSKLVADKFILWPLIPGAIIGLVGFALSYGGMALEILSWVGKSWPLGLIVVGLYLILWRKGFQSEHNQA